MVGDRYCIRVVKSELALADHVHEFDADEYITGTPERLKVEHWAGDVPARRCG